MDGPRLARSLQERFAPEDGTPLRLGEVWPPRLVVHELLRRIDDGEESVDCTLFVRHHLRDPLRLTISADGPAVGADGIERDGLTIEPVSFALPPVMRRGPGPGGGEHLPLTIRLRWDSSRMRVSTSWLRLPISLVLDDGAVARRFRWYAYLTPGPPEVPHYGALDDVPHFRWMHADGLPLELDGVARAWIELPAPLSSPTLPPACWVQPAHGPTLAQGPDHVEIVPVFPVEPPIAGGLEAVGWNGALGGHDPRPRVQALAVRSRSVAGQWRAPVEYWDAAHGRAPGIVKHPEPAVLEEPTDCIWPVVLAVETQPLALYDLITDERRGCEVKVDLRVVLPDDAESLTVRRADIRLGPLDVGRWEGPPVELVAGRERSLPCIVDLHRLRQASDGRLKLTLVLYGRPSRGVVDHEQTFRTENGPWARLHRSVGAVRTPWLSIDLGTEGTCAAVSFLDGYVPRVVSVVFDDGPVFPTRAWFAPTLGGAWTLTDDPTEDGLYTTLIKMGLRFGEGAHPGCPDHVAATEVARFFLKRFLLEVRERMAWFPLEDSDVLVSFPPRMASMPRFVAALRDTFRSVLEEVIWAGGRGGRLRFREEGLLVAVPALYRDLEVAPVPARGSRYYWVMDFGGGTTDVCGFLCTTDELGEETVVGRMTYPRRLAHHLSGNDVTAAFYTVLRHRLAEADLVAGPEVDEEFDGARRFPLPPTPFPSARSTAAALLNQNTLRELADALKCLPASRHDETVRAVAHRLPQTRMRTADGVGTTVVALLTHEARALGDLTVAHIHREVLQPRASGGPTFTVEQDGRTWELPDLGTLQRWILERRVSPADRLSIDGESRGLLGERSELRPLFARAEAVGADDHGTPDPASSGVEHRPGALGRAIERFLVACRDALDSALDELPDGRDTEVVVLVAGRASQFGPIVEGIERHMPGRVVHLTNAWVRRNYGAGGQIDPSAGLKTLTANGGGLFALLQSNPETSGLALSFDTQVMDCPVYLQALSAPHPWFLTRRLDLRPGHTTPVVTPADVASWASDRVGGAEEPPPRPLPVDTPLAGELALVVDGLPEDRGFEPYVVIARGTARRWQGRRARTTADTALRTDPDAFALERLAENREISFHRMLPRLELLGGTWDPDEPTEPR